MGLPKSFKDVSFGQFSPRYWCEAYVFILLLLTSRFSILLGKSEIWVRKLKLISR